MGLFGFGNKDKKNTEINNANKNQIMSILNQMQMQCRDANAMAIIKGIQTQLGSQGDTAKKEVMAIDGQILTLITEANTYLLKGQFPTAITKLAKAQDLAVDRTQYCMMGGRMTKQDAKRQKEVDRAMDKIKAQPKTRAEELQTLIDQKNAELDGLQKEFARLGEQYKANPTNQSIISQANTVKVKINAAQNMIATYTAELNKENTDSTIAEIAAQREQIKSTRTHTEEEMEVARAEFQAQNEDLKKLQQENAAGMDLLNQSVGGLFDNPFETSTTATMNNPFADTAFGTSTAPAQGTTQFGGFNSTDMGSASMANDIQREKRGIEDALDKYEDKLEDANEELEELNRELVPLLKKRQNASPSDCLILDGQIDKIQAKRGSIIYKIKRLRQAEAQLNDKLSLIEKLETQQDLEATNAQIEKLTGGKFADFAGLAMYLNESVKQSNEQLEEIGTAVSVAESEDIMMNSATGASAALSDASTNSKDEDKYAALEQELGLALR